MKRIAVFILLVVLSVAWSMPAKAQGTSNGLSEYERQSKVTAKKQQKITRKAVKREKKMAKKAAKKQQKATKKSAKADRKANKKANRRTR